MAIPYPNQLPLDDGFSQTHRRMLENIEKGASGGCKKSEARASSRGRLAS